MRIFLLFLILFGSLIGCRQTDAPKEHNKQSISDLSIYNLETEWKNQDGQTMQFKDLQGNVLVVVMIYTSCKAACPRLVADMKNICQAVGTTQKPIRYVLISIDPQKDTPEKLKEFSIQNNMTSQEWLFLRGTDETTREFANAIAVKYKEISPIDFSHSNIITVFDENGDMKYQQEGLGLNNDKIVQTIHGLSKNS